MKTTDVRAIRTLLGAAYLDDPLTAWIFRDEATRLDASAAWYGLFVEAYAATGRITEVVEDGELVGVCLWLGPDDGPPAWEGTPTVAGMLAALVGAAHADKVAEALHGIHAIQPDPPYAYVNFLAVRPGLQGRGFGLRALAPVLGSGYPVHLETTNPRNVPFYERAGFTVRAELRLGDDGPVLRAMQRQPE
jgi:GNAT superfamily N-acetyltransferase